MDRERIIRVILRVLKSLGDVWLTGIFAVVCCALAKISQRIIIYIDEWINKKK